jgi:hypothetical protein
MAESDEDEELRKLFEDETVESKLPFATDGCVG